MLDYLRGLNNFQIFSFNTLFRLRLPVGILIPSKNRENFGGNNYGKYNNLHIHYLWVL